MPTTRERTKRAEVQDRHSIPNPFFDLGGWYKTMMIGRIIDLFLTQRGVQGHAIQINQELQRLNDVIPYMRGQSLATAHDYEKSIKGKIIELALYCRFDFNHFTFYFSDYHTLSIEKMLAF